MDKFALAESYLHPYEAQIAKASLLESGINAIIENEHTIAMDWFYSQALGGVKVLVPVDDLARAKEILGTDYSAALEEEFGADRDTCASCSSRELKPHTRGRAGVFVSILLLGIPLLFYRNGYKCEDCGGFTET